MYTSKKGFVTWVKSFARRQGKPGRSRCDVRIADKAEKLERRRRRVRQRVFGTPARPRLSVFRSKSHIYAQIIDDTRGHTLAMASTLDLELKKAAQSKNPIDAAKEVGKLIASRAKAAKVGPVVFDRGGRLYHGRIKALAEASRESGLQF
ncbi:MAG: 50S ribosomal protein L18 [Nitrospiraceae bacterium]|nr:50S ribosomal protein L18 [Nitrospiraceae bacterium]